MNNHFNLQVWFDNNDVEDWGYFVSWKAALDYLHEWQAKGLVIARYKIVAKY
jgi:hypothetical protein